MTRIYSEFRDTWMQGSICIVDAARLDVVIQVEGYYQSIYIYPPIAFTY